MPNDCLQNFKILKYVCDNSSVGIPPPRKSSYANEVG